MRPLISLVFAFAVVCLGFGQGDFPVPPSPPGLTKANLRSTAPESLHETLGARIRRHALWAHTRSPFAKPFVCMCKPWQWGEAVLAGHRRVNGGNVYVCASAGTTATSGGGPTGQAAGGVISDNGVYWEYVGANTVTADPNSSLISWSPSLVLTAGQIIVIGGLVPGKLQYGVVNGGTTASTGTGPTATTNNITDGTATLTYMGVYQPSPYGQTGPVATVSTSQPSGYLWYSASAPACATSPTGVLGIIAKGSGYSVNDTITLTGGTHSVSSVLTVTSVQAGGVTGVSLTTPGTYTLYPQAIVGQGATSGAGSGATFTLTWPEPGWLHINNGYLAGASGGANNFALVAVMSTGAGQPITSRHISVQFATDESAPVFSWSSSSPAPANMQILYDEGNGWIPYNQDILPRVAGSQNYLTLNFPGGRMFRRFRIETANASTSATIPYIGITAGSVPIAWIDQDTIPVAVISDSIWDGNPVSPFSCGFSFESYLGYALDWNIWDFSKGGTGYVNAGSYNTFGARVTAVLAANPKIVLIYGSTNDIGQSSTSTIANAQSLFSALRSGGFIGPIIVWGVESVSATALTQEGYVQTATAWSDPLGLTFFVPISGTAIPPIIGAYNNNPTPGGLTLPLVNNFSKYINGSDSVHPLELGVQIEAQYAVNFMKQFVFPLIQ